MTCRGRIVAVVVELDPQPFGHLVGGHRSRDQQAAVVALDDERLTADILIGCKFARDRRQQVGGGDQAFEMTIFVVDKQHWHVGDTQGFQRVHRIDLVVDNLGRSHQLRKVERFAAEQRRGNVARLHHANNVVDRPARHRQAAVWRFDQLVAYPLRVERYVDPVDVLARRHHLAHRAVGEAHDARNDRALAFLDQPRFRRLGDDQVQLLGGHPVLGFAVEAQDAEHQRRTAVEQPHQRRADFRQPQHRQRDEDRDRFGRAQRKLLRHQLADDQREIGGHRDHHRKPDRQRGFIVETQQQLQSLAHWAAQAGPRIGTGQNADQRDPDLYSRQEAPRIGGQLACDRSAAAAALFCGLQARRARRHDREFGHREDAIQKDQDGDDRHVGPWERGHWAVVRRVGARPLSASVMNGL